MTLGVNDSFIATIKDEAWVTLATDASYSVGALVLARSLRIVNTTKKLVILITKDVPSDMISLLSGSFDEVVHVDTLSLKDVSNLCLLKRPELSVTLTKLHCWKLMQYSKCVFLDADTLVVKNCDELFDRCEFSAAPDAGWPDCFNTGVFVFCPSLETFEAITEEAERHGSFDGGDQGLLNSFYSSWATKDIDKHLPFIYNMSASATYTYLPAYIHYGDRVKIVHFLGTSKPWHASFTSQGTPFSNNDCELHTSKHLLHWWTIFLEFVRPNLPSSLLDEVVWNSRHIMKGDIASKFSEASPSSNQFAWEQGVPDYKKTSSFNNIIKKIETTMNVSEVSTEFSQLNFCCSPVTKVANRCLKSICSSVTFEHDVSEDQICKKPLDTLCAVIHPELNVQELEPDINSADYSISSCETEINSSVCNIWSFESQIKSAGSSSILSCDPEKSISDSYIPEPEFLNSSLVVEENAVDDSPLFHNNDLYKAAKIEHQMSLWEHGCPDYMGKSSFDNIMKQILFTMQIYEEIPKVF